jgi:hypothetical protein
MQCSRSIVSKLCTIYSNCIKFPNFPKCLQILRLAQYIFLQLNLSLISALYKSTLIPNFARSLQFCEVLQKVAKLCIPLADLNFNIYHFPDDTRL